MLTVIAGEKTREDGPQGVREGLPMDEYPPQSGTIRKVELEAQPAVDTE